MTRTDSMRACILTPLGGWSGLCAYLCACMCVCMRVCMRACMCVHLWCVCRYGKCGCVECVATESHVTSWHVLYTAALEFSLQCA